MITEHFFDDSNTLIEALGAECETILRSATATAESAALLVSGGRTPIPLFRKLSEADLDWAKVSVALVDERWVDMDSPASNEALVRNNLLQNKASAANFIAMKSSDKTALLAQPGCERAYQQLSRPYAFALLGMGPDGHIASLFPAAEGLDSALDASATNLCAAITARQSAVTGEFTERMSLTLAALLQSRQLHLWITGEEKLAVYRSALAQPDQALMPVSAILHQDRIPVEVYWSP